MEPGRVVLAALIGKRVDDGDAVPSAVNGETSVWQADGGARSGTIGVG